MHTICQQLKKDMEEQKSLKNNCDWVMSVVWWWENTWVKLKTKDVNHKNASLPSFNFSSSPNCSLMLTINVDSWRIINSKLIQNNYRVMVGKLSGLEINFQSQKPSPQSCMKFKEIWCQKMSFKISPNSHFYCFACPSLSKKHFAWFDLLKKEFFGKFSLLDFYHTHMNSL